MDVQNILKEKLGQIIENSTPPSYNIIKNTKLNELQLDILLEILNSQLSDEIVITCNTGKISVRGDFIKFSSVNKYLNGKECSNWTTLEIFALQKFFIDDRLNITDNGLQLIIMSPAWEFANAEDLVSYRIDFNGRDANAHELRKAKNGASAKEIDFNGMNGKIGQDGKPGLPGGDGGSVFILGGKLYNDGVLIIRSKGGEGGLGQNGGDGGKGGDGNEGKQIYDGIVSGGNGGNGGNGGRGGMSGYFGDFGEIIVIGLDKSYRKYSIILPTFKKGFFGTSGKGGDGGQGGKAGKSCKYWTVSGGTFILPTYDTYKTCTPDNTGQREGQNGLKGEDGGNDSKMRLPIKTEIQNKAIIINTFKAYMSKNLNSRVKKHGLTKFIRELNNNDDANGLYDILGCMNEMQTLEKIYNTIQYKKDLIPFYNGLKNRITYVKNNSTVKNNQNLMLLDYISHEINSKVIYIESKYENELILDIENFISTVVSNNIEKLKVSNNLAGVHKEIELYKKESDKKIDEGLSFIDNHIIPSIELINDRMSNLIENNLIDEIVAEERRVKKQIGELESMVRRAIFSSILKITGTACSLLGPIGVIASKFLEFSTSIVDPPSPAEVANNLPKGVQNLDERLNSVKSFIRNINNDDTEILQAQINIINTEGTKSTDLKKIAEDLNKNVFQSKFNRTEFEEIVNEQSKIFKDDKAIAKVKAIGRVAGASVEIFHQFKNDMNKVEAFSRLIDASQSQLDSLFNLRATVVNDFVPMLRDMSADLEAVMTTLVTKTHIGLDIAKFSIDSSLQKLRTSLNTITKGFKVDLTIQNFVSDLVRSVEFLVNMFHRIQDYKDNQRFAEFLAKLSSDRWNSLKINDENLKLAKVDLDVLLNANEVTGNYENIVKNLKHSIFPYAYKYFNGYKALNYNAEIVDLALVSADRINNLKTSIPSAKHSTLSAFITEEKQIFFEWSNNLFGDVIQDLLEGKEIKLRANISDSDLNAVKFNEIHLNLKSNNQDEQIKLNEILNNDFKIELSHLGDSYYKCGKNIFMIPSKMKKMYFSFAMAPNGNPMITNGVHEELRDSDHFLSPFATWSIKLIANSNNGYENLFKLRNQIYLQLAGNGKYLTKEQEHVQVCRSPLSAYKKFKV